MKNIYQALFDFQQEVPVILKESSGYNYKYADLPQIDEVIKPLLKKHKLGVLQPLTCVKNVGDFSGGGGGIRTIIYHTESGESIEDITPLPSTRLERVTIKKTDKNGVVTESEKYVVAGFEQMSEPQAQGSIITYYRRYSLASFLGLITDKDTDGAGLSNNKDVPF